MRLDAPGIAALIPHKGAMSFLDGVLRVDEAHIVCSARSHTDPGHPLARGGRLHALAGLEYGAQAMALHGALMDAGDGPSKMGVIASVRALTWTVERLDDIATPLEIEARRITGSGAQVAYTFAIRAGTGDIVSGRITALLRTGLP